MKATEAAYLGLLQLKIIIGLLKFRIFSNSRKGSIKSGSHCSAHDLLFRQTDKKTRFPHQPIKIYVKNVATDGASYQTIFLG
jgi:hypothetical protein